MVEYLRFWLAQSLMAVLVAGVALLILFGAMLWSLRGQKFYKEPKKNKEKR